MALQPRNFSSQEMLSPGARGEMFVNDGIPGHRGEGERINRTNNSLDISRHDVLNNKYGLDPRLPSLFRYGWAYGYNQIVIPKGRIVAADPYLMVMDTDTGHFFNAVTLANGGKNVRLAQAADFAEDGKLENLAHVATQLIGKIWVECDDVLATDDATLKETGGLVKVGGTVRKDIRPANVPLGLIERNEYTRSVDAYNGIMFGPIRTDALVELPWFGEGEKAMLNPWGSVIGKIKPGDLLCADENGRFVQSPLMRQDKTKALGGCSDATAIEVMNMQRQVVGEVYATDMSLIPEGAAKYAQWALSDRLKFNDFNPYEYPQTNRTGEDFVTNPPTAYQADFRYPGYPMEQGFLSKDLNMLASTRDGMYDPRFDEAHRLDRGIPGLTDGYNAVIRAFNTDAGEGDVALAGHPTATVGKFHVLVTGEEKFLDDPDRFRYLMRVQERAMEKIKVGLFEEGKPAVKEGAEVIIDHNIAAGDTPLALGTHFEVVYADIHKGLVEIHQKGLTTEEEGTRYDIRFAYVKRGMAGVPTQLDWDGCKGTAIILMNK